MKKSICMLLAVLTLPGLAQHNRNLQHRPNRRSESRFQKLNPDEVKQYETGIMRQIADLALIPPEINTSPLPEYDYDTQDYVMALTIEQTAKGRIWAAWIGGCDCPDAFLLAATSDNQGETWSKPRLVIDGRSPSLPIPRTVIIGNFWRDPSERLWLFFDQTMNHFDGRAGLWAIVCENPDAENPIWSGPKRIWHGSMLNKPVVLSSGEWLLPSYLRGIRSFHHPDWLEAMIVEKRDGQLWMMARTRKGIMESFSPDQGFTWSEPAFTAADIQHPNSRFFFRRLASGRILLIKNGKELHQHQGRNYFSAWLSEDDGKTWTGGLVIDDREKVTYPDGFQAWDGTIYIAYDHNRGPGEIVLAKFTEEDILAGNIVNPQSKLKMIITRPLKNKKQMQ